MLSLRTGRCRCAACHSPSSLYLEGGAYAGLLPEAPLNTLVEKTGPKEGGVRVSKKKKDGPTKKCFRVLFPSFISEKNPNDFRVRLTTIKVVSLHVAFVQN